MKDIGFIGVGIMGKSMVRNLMKAGFAVHIYARHPEKVADVTGEGAILEPSVAACAKGRDAVITIVGYPADVESVYFGAGGILESADPGTYVIDMTTSSPQLAARIAKAAGEKGLRGMDAPVTGGDVGARNGTLSILVGGAEADYEACLPLFQAMGTNINRMGGAGCGQHAKLANQIAIAGTLAGLCEALTYAQKEELDLEVLLRAISTGAAGSKQMDAYAPRLLKGDYAPGFFMKHFIKDMRLAQQEAEAADMLPGLTVLSDVLDMCETLEKEGKGDLGNHALAQYYGFEA